MKTYKDLYDEARRECRVWSERYMWQGVAAYQLRYAKREAAIRDAWKAAEEAGLVRLRIEPDVCWDLGDLLGDCYDPAVNHDIKPERLEREKQEEIDRINRDGVWEIIGEYRHKPCNVCGCGGGWEFADSCGGFVGDDWKGSGYDLDIMETTLRAAGLMGRTE